ncbi:DUF3667 domain-containing protein [Spirosoma fluviale]|uniref:DUF3667 domain-containing protein n=1 Tax=Spirosoma fluviale TaxID=1597977 RepID=A0A286F9E4_9BACT|nr:DUF3667 domain-containing protein [Spirosoma fluviale]SOD79813.1 Protein of unknown function [Spirosoma fluviale]
MTSSPIADSNAHPSDELTTCLNCEHPVTGQYCKQCGQQADTHRINWYYLWHEISQSLWGIDRGILFTLRELFVRPGYTIREFLAGKRINHYRPLALLLLLGAIYVFVSQVLHVDLLKASQEVYSYPKPKADSPAQVNEILTKYFQVLDENQQFGDLVMVPFIAFWCRRLFQRSGYNYPEMLVAQTFMANFGLFFSLVMLLAFWVLGDSATILTSIMSVSMLIPLAYNAFAHTQLFKGKLRPLSIVLRSVSAYLLGYVSLILVMSFILFVYAFIFAVSTEQNKALPKKTKPAVSQHAHS